LNLFLDRSAVAGRLLGEQAVDKVAKADEGLVGLLMHVHPFWLWAKPGAEHENAGIDQEQAH
ncbi:MAG: hypothetical protein ACO3DT_04390, partial [Gammaproteobacteria bacterium]